MYVYLLYKIDEFAHECCGDDCCGFGDNKELDSAWSKKKDLNTYLKKLKSGPNSILYRSTEIEKIKVK